MGDSENDCKGKVLDVKTEVIREIVIKRKCEVGTEVESKVHVEVEGSLGTGISELFEREDRRDGIGNIVVE